MLTFVYLTFFFKEYILLFRAKMTSTIFRSNMSCFSKASSCLYPHLSLVLQQVCLNEPECSNTHSCPHLLPNVPQQLVLMASPN